MYEYLLELLPESVRTCRALYDYANGGYPIPVRAQNHQLRMSDLDEYRRTYDKLQFDPVEAPVADLLYSLVVNTRSAVILETGTSRGFSTSHLAAGAAVSGESHARVITIDKERLPHRFFEGSQIERLITPINDDSLTCNLGAATGGHEIDFLFLDSYHNYAHLAGEVQRFLPKLRLGGMLALHDTFYYDGLGLVVLHLMRNEALETVSLSTHRTHRNVNGGRSPGVTLFRKIAPVDAEQLRFPDLSGVADRELVNLSNSASLLAQGGGHFARHHYEAARQASLPKRGHSDPALLEPFGHAQHMRTPAC